MAYKLVVQFKHILFAKKLQMGLDTSYNNISEVLSLLQKQKQKMITHNGDNNTNKFYNMIYLDDNKCGHRNVLSKRQVWMSIFHIINLKKKGKSWSWIFFNKKLILDYYFCLKSGPVFLFQIFIIAPLPSQGI